MKKNISTNLQGIIFHIEEDGYETLSRYLAEVKAHFSGYRGHEEIVADIESRIAELFVSRLSASKQIISLADVEQMIGKMGRVRDFQAAGEAEEEEEILADAVADGTAAGHYTSSGARPGTGSTDRAAASDVPPTAEAGPKRLYRDMANRKIAGVAAGVARYFAVNPLWVRLGFLALLFVRPLVRSIFNFGAGFHFGPGDLFFRGFDLGGFAVISYVVLWIVLPKRYDTVSIDEDPTIKKLYRDVDNGKVGGVSSGLAAYFRVDVVLIRILFFVGLFAGGFSFVLYIVLWILVPEAKTASDKLRMRGDAVTLSSLDNNLRSQATETGDAAPTGNRPIGTFIEDAGRNLRPRRGLPGHANSGSGRAGARHRWFYYAAGLHRGAGRGAGSAARVAGLHSYGAVSRLLVHQQRADLGTADLLRRGGHSRAGHAATRLGVATAPGRAEPAGGPVPTWPVAAEHRGRQLRRRAHQP